MSYGEKLQALARKGFTPDWARRASQRAELAEQIRAICLKLEPSEWITSSELLRRIVGKEIAKENAVVTYFTSGSHYLRKFGEVAGCWEHGARNARSFGHPAIHWINPGSTAGLEGIL